MDMLGLCSHVMMPNLAMIQRRIPFKQGMKIYNLCYSDLVHEFRIIVFVRHEYVGSKFLYVLICVELSVVHYSEK